MGLLSKFLSNTRKPEGFFGRMMVNGMNGGPHARLAEWGLSYALLAEDYHVLDVGCGGGANIARLLQRCPKGTVTGLDYSSVSVKKTSQVNAAAIAAGRCKVIEGSAAALPFADQSFDLVTAFETVYFWPEIQECFRGVYRTLKTGGQFLIVNESDGTNPMDAKWESLIEGMHTYSPEELTQHLTTAQFRDITIHRDDQHHWLCMTAIK